MIKRLLDVKASSNVRMLNVAAHGVTMVSRFLLIFFLAKFLQPAELGLYGLVVAAIGYSLYFLGFDFYIFVGREIIKRDVSEWGGIIKGQCAISSLLYLVFIPSALLLFFLGILPWKISLWFFLLLVLEHINQELGRLLVVISQQFFASLLLFLRQGLWAVAITTLMCLSPDFRDLNYVFALWSVAGTLSALAGFYGLSSLGVAGWRVKVDWSWVFAGLKVCVPFLVATLAIRGVFTIDRYWVQELSGLEMVGVYVLFVGIASALLTFLDAGVFSFCYPDMIRAHQNGNADLFRERYVSSMILSVAMTVLFVLVSLFMLFPLLGWLGKTLYIENDWLYPWVLAAMSVYTLSMVPHFGLYSQGLDRSIIRSHVAALFVFLFVTYFSSKYYKDLAVPIGLLSSFSTILILKLLAFYRNSPKNYWLRGASRKDVRG